MEHLRFLTETHIQSLISRFDTPLFVYSEKILREQAKKVKAFSKRAGFLPRYAMKTSSNKNILKIFHEEGLHIDASSGYEVYRAIEAGIPPSHIQLTGQEMPQDLRKIVDLGVEFNATSLHQLEVFWSMFPWSDASIRINPGLWSGWTNRTNVGWPGSSFWIWYEYLDEVKNLAKKYNLTIKKLHTHIGSGSDPEVWKKVAGMVLGIVEKLPDVERVSLGGGFKVARMSTEKWANLEEIGAHIDTLFDDFEARHSRILTLEIEPWTFLAANSASLVTEIIDRVDTGKEGYTFIKVNAWMTEVTRPSLYGAQHPIIVVPRYPRPEMSTKEYIVVWHNCESGDIFTPAPWDPEWLAPRTLSQAEIWDILIIESVGSYCASMSTHGYNSFPEAGEVLLREDGTLVEIRRRASDTELWRNEIQVI